MKCWISVACVLLSGSLPSILAQEPKKETEPKAVQGPQEEFKLPEPPAGFRWERFPEMGAAFLCPKGWFVKHEEAKGTVAGFVTQEEIVKDGTFETGLTVNYFTKFSAKGRDKPSVYAANFAATAVKAKKSLMAPAVRKVDRLTTVIFRIEGDGTIVHHLLVADDKFDTLHLLMFESPSKEWDAAWTKGELILKRVGFQFPD